MLGVTPAQAIDRLLDEFDVAEADLRDEVGEVRNASTR